MSKIVSYIVLVALGATISQSAAAYPNDTDWREALSEMIQKEMRLMPH